MFFLSLKFIVSNYFIGWFVRGSKLIKTGVKEKFLHNLDSNSENQIENLSCSKIFEFSS